MEKGVPIRSVSRAISILQAINQTGPLSMMQISRRGRVPYPTACRIVQTLIHEGLIEQEPARKYYRPTALVQSLSQGYHSDGFLIECANPHIRALTQKFGWPVSLTVRVGTQMVVRDSTHAITSLTFENYNPGYRLPLLDCASGRVCLASMSQEELDHVMRSITEAGDKTDQAMTAYVSIESLNKIQEQGFAAIDWGRHNLTPGKTSSIAVPIYRNGSFAAALTLIYFSAAMKQTEAIERYFEDLQNVATIISRSLSNDESSATGEGS